MELREAELTATNLTVGEEGRKGGRQGICGGRHRLRQGGYAVTSHSSQGQTADRVLIHTDTELGAKDLLNNRMAYVAVSPAHTSSPRTARSWARRWGMMSRTAAPMRQR